MEPFNDLIETLKQQTDSKRAEFFTILFSALRSNFCLECGIITDRVCQCSNDE